MPRRRLLVSFAIALLALSACDQGGFDAKVWRAEKGNYDRDSRRSAMLPDLLDVHLKPGASKADILALLGPADASGPDGETYYLGRSPYGIDYETLHITFDAEGKLVSATLQRS